MMKILTEGHGLGWHHHHLLTVPFFNYKLGANINEVNPDECQSPTNFRWMTIEENLICDGS